MRTFGYFLLGLLAALIVADGVLSLLPVPSGMFAAAPDPHWPARRLVPGGKLISSFGWQLANVHRSRINALGYASPFDYDDGAHVGVVIGDSFVEGLSNDDTQRFQSYLARDLGLAPTGVYSFGTGGASLPHYLGVARLAGARYRPAWAVILIGVDDFEEGFGHVPGFFHWNAPPETIGLEPEIARGRLSRFARELALNRYVRLNLKFSPATLFASGMPASARRPCRPAHLSAEHTALLAGWIADLPRALNLPADRVALVFDSDRSALYATGAAPAPSCATEDTVARATLARRAAAAGFPVIDTAPIFARDWRLHHIPFDRSPLDVHWTPHANAVVAQATVRALMPRPSDTSRQR